jgi:hypothetical protein
MGLRLVLKRKSVHGESQMKLRIVCWMLVFFSLVLPMAAQVSGSGKTNYIPIWTDGNTLGDSVIFQTGGKVGIGTVTPAASLTVNGQFVRVGSAPMVLSVTGSGGGPYGGNGGGIALTTGGGGGGSNGGEMVFTTGSGGEAPTFSPSIISPKFSSARK